MYCVCNKTFIIIIIIIIETMLKQHNIHLLYISDR